ncbi:MAG: metallophosphoesterase [Clostridia bacterium]|nr:metallophosphoesterase [Clostridia bacterium]
MMKIYPRLGALVLAMAGALILVSFFGQLDFHIEAFEARLGISFFDHGYTKLVLPPIGEIRARTHQTPLQINITLKNIDLNLLKAMLKESPDRAALLAKVEEEMRKTIIFFVGRIFFLSALGGALGILALHRRGVLPYLKGAAAGVVLVAALLATTWFTFDQHRFVNPEFRGILKAAPWMMGFVQEGLVKVNTLSKQMEVMADNLYTLFEKIDKLQAFGAVNGRLKVLHISDLHNNPAGLRLAEEVARTFAVDMVIDTGDITDFGSPLENHLLERLAQLKVPYVVTLGNHDSAQTMERLKKFPNVTLVNDREVNVKGLRMAGIFDPAALTVDVVPPPSETMEKYVGKLKDLLAGLDHVPDLLLVHNPRMARKFTGKVPVVLFGHTHRYSVRQAQGSVLINAGTTGAAGLQGLQSAKEIPYTLYVLHFNPRPGQGYQLIAADLLRVANLESGFTLERKVFIQEDAVSDVTSVERRP